MAAVAGAGNESLGSVSYNGANSGTILATLTTSTGLSGDLQNGSVASFRLAAGDADVSMVVNSRNFGTAANRPALILSASAVPEPSRFIFFVASLMCLKIRRTR